VSWGSGPASPMFTATPAPRSICCSGVFAGAGGGGEGESLFGVVVPAGAGVAPAADCKWVHMLGFRGHFASKSHRYAITLGALRRARRRASMLIATGPAPTTPHNLGGVVVAVEAQRLAQLGIVVAVAHQAMQRVAVAAMAGGRGGGADPPALCASNLVCGCRPQRGYDTGPTATGAPNYAPKCSALSADVRWCSLMCVVVLYSDPCCAGPLSNRWQPAQSLSIRGLSATAPAQDRAIDVGADALDNVGGGIEEPLKPDPVEDSGVTRRTSTSICRTGAVRAARAASGPAR
jgi:hypothetical protein